MSKIFFTNGHIHTMAPGQPTLENLLVQDGRIAAGNLPSDQRPEDAQRVDLEGQTLLPGLHDSHLHLLDYQLSKTGVDLSQVTSLAELKQKVQTFITENQIPAGSWVTGFGWNQERFAEKRLPTRWDLDEISTHHPIFLKRICIHIGVVNSPLLALCTGSAQAVTDNLGRDEDGQLNGLVYEEALQNLVLVNKPPLSQAAIAAALKAGTQEAVQLGLSTIQSDDLQTFPDLAAKERILKAYLYLQGQGELPLRVFAQMQVGSYAELQQLFGLLPQLGFTSPAKTQPVWAPAAGCRTPPEGDGRFHLHTVKVLLDGTLGGWTAALRYPYQDRPETTGVLNFTDEELLAMVRLSLTEGYQIACHVIGGRALDQYLRILGQLETEFGAHLAASRPRAVHAPLVEPDHLGQLRRFGVLADIQPAFVASDYQLAQTRLPPAFQPASYGWQTLQKAGIPLAGSSDCPVESLNPFTGMQSALTRQTATGAPTGGWHPQERLSRWESLRLYTTGAAYSVHQESHLGQLQKGFLADLLVVDQDPFTCPPADLPQIQPQAVYCGGQLTWQSEHGGV